MYRTHSRRLLASNRAGTGWLRPGGLLLLLVLPLRAGSAAPAQSQGGFEVALRTPVKEFALLNRPVIEGLFDLADRYKVPLGVEYLDARLMRHPVSLRLENITVATAFEALVKPLQEYQVDYSHGLVEVYSPKARRDPSNILNMTISRFQVAHVNAMDASLQLEEEVFARLNPGVGFGGDYAYGANAPTQPKVTLDLNDRKVYEILNAIVAADGEAMWLVRVPPEGLSFFNWNRWSIHGLDPAGKEPILASLRELFPAPKQP
jgi:hypothetical protein